MIALHHRSSRAIAAFALLPILMVSVGAALAPTTLPPSIALAAVAIAIGIWWWLAVSRIIPMLLVLTGERAPGKLRTVFAALAGQLAISLSFGTLWVAVLGGDARQAAVVCFTAAMAGLLAGALSPAMVGVAAVIGVIGPRLLSWLPADALAWVERPSLAMLPLALIIANVAIGAWLLRGRPPTGQWTMPIAVTMHQLPMLAPTARGDRLSQWLERNRSDARASTPLARLAFALGRPFHTRDWRGMLVEISPALALVLLWALLAINGSSPSTQGGFAPLIVLLLGMTGALRLRQVAARPSAEASELPLLPGLPAGDDWVDALDRLALDAALRGPLAGGLLFGAYMLSVGAPPANIHLLAVIAASAAPLGRLATLWLAGSRDSTAVLVTMAVLGLAVFISSALLNKPAVADSIGVPLVLGWLLPGALAAMLLPLARRRLRRQRPARMLAR